MTSVTRVPEPGLPSGDELSADQARLAVRRIGLRPLARDTFVRFRYGDGFSSSRALAFQLCLAIVPLTIAAIGLTGTPASGMRRSRTVRRPAQGRPARSRRASVSPAPPPGGCGPPPAACCGGRAAEPPGLRSLPVAQVVAGALPQGHEGGPGRDVLEDEGAVAVSDRCCLSGEQVVQWHDLWHADLRKDETPYIVGGLDVDVAGLEPATSRV